MLEQKTYKNYKELCGAMEWEPVGGNAKKKQLKELNNLCNYHKEGHKFIIDEVFENPLPPTPIKYKGNPKVFREFDVDKEIESNGGVYIIQLKDEIYIGSTNNFRRRFRQHHVKCNNLSPNVRDLINRGGVFSVLHDMTDIEDVELLRMVEYEYIKYFRDSGKFTMLNGKDPISFDKYYKLNKREKKQKYIRFKIKEEDWDKVAEFLKDNNIEVIN